MVQTVGQESDKKAAQRARWEAMRPRVMGQRWLKQIAALETSVDALALCLEPPAETHARRLSHKPESAITQAALSKALKTVELTCRHMRMEKQHDGARDANVVLPLLEKLERSPSMRDELAERGLQGSVFAITRRTEAVDEMRRIIRDYADTIGKLVTPESMYHAYCHDFHGLEPAKFEAHPFVEHMNQTTGELRVLAMAHSMQYLASLLTGKNEIKITSTAIRFNERLQGLHLGYGVEVHQWLACLSDPKSTPDARADAKTQLYPWLQKTSARILGQANDETVFAQFDKKHKQRLLDAYQQDEAEFCKPRSQTPPTKADMLKITGAYETQKQLSYLRAEAALGRLDKLLETHWRDVERLYPNAQSSGRKVGR